MLRLAFDFIITWRETRTRPNAYIIKNIRIEQAYKGNFHLLAEIDGHERKFIIGKNKEEFSLIESMGIANLSSNQLKDMVEKYFIHLKV